MMTTKPMPRSSSRTRAENLTNYAYKGQEFAYMQATGHRSRNSSPSQPRSTLARKPGSVTSTTGEPTFGKHGGNYRGVPPEPEVDYVDPFAPKKSQKKSLVNGVKVMFNANKTKNSAAALSHKDIKEVTTKINSPYSHFQPRPRSISPIKVGPSSQDRTSSETGSQRQFIGNQPTDGNEIVLRNTLDENDDSLEDDASVKIVPVEIWDSGQVLVGNSSNREQSCTTIPGEGKLMTTCEERSQVWRHKTRRKYYENVKKDKSNRDNRDAGSDVGSRASQMSTSRRPRPKTTIEYSTARTDDDKLYSAGDLDEVFLDKKRQGVIMDHSQDQAKQVRWSEHQGRRSNSSHSHLHQTNSSTLVTNGHNQNGHSLSNGNRTSLYKPVETPETYHDDFPYLESYLPQMKDQSTQCNIPKPHKSKRDSRFEIAQDFRVIRSSKKDGSVSTFSDVPPMAAPPPPLVSDKPPPLVRSDGVVYSEVTTSRGPTSATTVTKTITRDSPPAAENPNEYLYESNPVRSVSYRMQSRSPSPPPPLISRRKPSPSPLLRRREGADHISRSRTKTRSYGFQMSNALGPDPITPKRGANMQPPSDWYINPSTNLSTEHAQERVKRAYERTPARETLEETISISNASSDEMSVRNGYDVDERKTMNSVVREVDAEKKVLTYENPNTRGRTNQQSVPYENNASSIWFKSLDEDYRRGMARSEVSFPALGLTSDGPPPTTSYATMTRPTKRSPPELVPRYEYEARSSPMTQAYTLDRRYLEERRKNRASSLKQGPVMGRREMVDNGFLNGQSASDRCGPTSGTMRRFASQRSVLTNEGFNILNADRRGGLAQAYRTRQKRASSLNRPGASTDRNSMTGSQYRLAQESDPVVMYIPAVSHQSVKFDEDDRMSGLQLARSQSNLATTRRPPKYGGKPALKKDENRNVTIASGYQVMNHPNGARDFDMDSDSSKTRGSKLTKKDLKRSQSMPLNTQKESKFPWLQKLGIRVKPRDP